MHDAVQTGGIQKRFVKSEISIVDVPPAFGDVQ